VSSSVAVASSASGTAAFAAPVQLDAVELREPLPEGSVLFVGSNVYNQGGPSKERSLHSTVRVVVLKMKKRVVMVAAGLYHTVLVTDADEVYSCGNLALIVAAVFYAACFVWHTPSFSLCS
jgi:hypothetical protein